jgi:nucleoid-associated protein YgaU
MVSRKQKLFAAGAVLATGFAIALLFRREPEPRSSAPTPALAASAAQSVNVPSSASPLVSTGRDMLAGQFSPLQPLSASNAGSVSTSHDGRVALPVVDTPPIEVAGIGASPPQPTVMTTVGDAPSSVAVDSAAPTFRIHVVHNGDTLERLADRYLGDGGRALELFDLNRDLLENPHLLPIGAQLRIPGAAAADAD